MAEDLCKTYRASNAVTRVFLKLLLSAVQIMAECGFSTVTCLLAYAKTK